MPEQARSRRGPLIVWLAVMAAILIGSLVPESEAPGPDGLMPQDWNLFHVPAYAALAVTSAWLLQARWRLTMPAAVGISLVFATVLGGAIEWIQPLVGRTESLLDFGLNEFGVVLGAGLVAAYQISGQPARRR